MKLDMQTRLEALELLKNPSLEPAFLERVIAADRKLETATHPGERYLLIQERDNYLRLANKLRANRNLLVRLGLRLREAYLMRLRTPKSDVPSRTAQSDSPAAGPTSNHELDLTTSRPASVVESAPNEGRAREANQPTTIAGGRRKINRGPKPNPHIAARDAFIRNCSEKAASKIAIALDSFLSRDSRGVVHGLPDHYFENYGIKDFSGAVRHPLLRGNVSKMFSKARNHSPSPPKG
jgi:hypothetical protein